MAVLADNWLAIELGALNDDSDEWSVGMRDSFNSLFEEQVKDKHDLTITPSRPASVQLTGLELQA